ncbi:MAG TPA: TIGR03619 family F420-dependent LLM class oxidoreductase [Microthrixaceae bacterium]|nr:TIGR03619 family F420-dependent LLM class oxidoreductase [Microthrixaceae bacterium]
MRFSYAESLCDVTHYVSLAQAAEEAGWHSMVVPDSVAYPRDSDSKYPYNGTGEREFLDDQPFIEPFVLIPTLAAVTERIKFATFVLKLAIRQPVIVAKQATSTAVLSNNRLTLGVGLSPWPEDFTITQSQWRARGRRMDEMIDIVSGLCRPSADEGSPSTDFFEYSGSFYEIPAIKMCPAPTRKIPILIGGQSDAALKRAARVGDGWMHAGMGDGSDLGEQIATLSRYRTEFGRCDEPFEIHVISLDAYSVDGVKRLEDLGVTDVIVGFRDPYSMPDTPLQPKLDALRRFADQVIAKV